MAESSSIVVENDDRSDLLMAVVSNITDHWNLILESHST